MYKHILIPTDGSPLSYIAVDKGLELAKALGARVTAVVVVEPFHIFASESNRISNLRSEYDKQIWEKAAQYLGVAKEKAAALGVELDTVEIENDRPFESIIETATKKGCDLIAMATHGRGGVGSIVLGSQTQKVLTHTKLPVLVFR
ncbi:putative universal stress protein [Hartmannibacter diazotrophicus]|uniref:Putative universal stress protein n=1 Tax=Hartmannibacter diazotrophicus TaxID=1482074 RepID=A0A2C9D7S9_9HYPH|nr:universal stress protein [Hartmannibacter diazotrophicus]SON56367.1 putative universal stress protein [Hartmannibacter diazotrophicus]